MIGIPRSIGLKTALGAALATTLTLLGACSLNPQPLPPDTADSASMFTLADAKVEEDGGQVDAQAGGSFPDGAPLIDGSFDDHFIEGGTDAADGSPKDVATEGSREAGLSDGHAMDSEVP
jgi:hypothetical protein